MARKKATSVWRRSLRKFRAILIAGLVVTVPIGLTIWVFVWLFNEIRRLLQPIIKAIFGHEITGVGLGVIAVLVQVIGAVATNVTGKRIIHWDESLLSRVPISRTLTLE